MDSVAKGTLYIVATPIGNLGDITARALDTLKTVDLILCEDTRVTKTLLAHFGIEKPTKSYHQHSAEHVQREIRTFLTAGRHVALVTDAGTPGISDPGGMLIDFLLQTSDSINIVPMPGVSAIATALSICGFPTEKFLFLGFPPHKNKRKKFFEEVAASEYTTAFYESSHRIKKALDELATLIPDRRICVCRELTKKFETIYRGTVGEIVKQNISEKGEFVVIVSR